MTLEILDASGATIRRYSSDDPVTPVNPDALAVSLLWASAPQTLATTAGLHRWVWDFRPTPVGRWPRAGGAAAAAVAAAVAVHRLRCRAPTPSS